MKRGADPDPVLSEVIANLLMSVADEIGLSLIRTAHSPNIRERRDCSTAVLDAQGQIVAQTPFIPMHLGSMVGLIAAVLNRFPKESLRRGDVIIANDPYSGGGAHLPDFTVVSPVIHDGEMVAFVANIAHHADVGGQVPGSESAACTTIYQEGIRIPPVRMQPDLGVDDPVIQIILLNSRTPEERYGDLRAQLAALHVGVMGVMEIFERYGTGTVLRCMDHFLDYSERRIRSAVGRLREGRYTFVDCLDDDGFGDQPVRIQCAATIGGGGIRLDFAGTAPQMNSGKNVPLVATMSVAHCVVKMLLDPELPPNTGTYRAVTIDAPEGCLVNPLPPAAVGARAISCGILGDVIVGALNQAMPDKALAQSGPHALTTFACPDPPTGRPFVDYETIAGALGARPYRDGMDAVRIHASGAANLPVESLELDYALRVERYELIRDGGGAGAFRGGMPVRRDTRVMAAGTTVSTTGDRQRSGAPGIDGGRSGVSGAFIVNPDTAGERPIPTVSASLPLEPGDVVSVRTPGGGGFGDPLDRDPEKVLQDLLDERISETSARDDYGIIVRDAKLDAPATRRQRRRLRSKKAKQ